MKFAELKETTLIFSLMEALASVAASAAICRFKEVIFYGKLKKNVQESKDVLRYEREAEETP
jgi:hypothetical protein